MFTLMFDNSITAHFKNFLIRGNTVQIINPEIVDYRLISWLQSSPNTPINFDIVSDKSHIFLNNVILKQYDAHKVYLNFEQFFSI